MVLLSLSACTFPNETTITSDESTPKGWSSNTGKGSDRSAKDGKTETDNNSQSNGEEDGVRSVFDEALDFCNVSQEYWQKGELENALEALDQAYALILDVDTHNQPKLIQQKEDLRFLISKRILEIYASRNTVVNGNHNAIPMTINRHVQAEIDLFAGREKTFFIESYRRSGKYRARIVKALKEAGLPVELAWLPLIESGFKVNALSRARALGLWQFIPSTGYKFGLKRNKFVDERLDPEKATTAAIAYLKELHQIFGDWTTCLAAYNCGEGRVLRVIRSQKINYLDHFWDLYELLPRETARYVPRFLATLHVIKNAEKFGLNEIVPDTPLDYETVTVNRQIHLKHVATTVGASLEAMKELNPELRYQIVPPESYTLKIPEGKKDLLLAQLETIPITKPPQRAYVYHRIRRGQTLSTIARRYRTSVGSIMRANRLRRSGYIVAGRVLKIPRKGYMTASSQSPKTVKKRAPKRYQRASVHVVKRGDSLWNIARRYHTTTKKIQELNGLKGNSLSIGQKLKIPGRKPSPPVATPNLNVYSVKSGDSPYHIAHQHNMTLNRFLTINRLTPRSKIYPGQKVYVD
jgi:membrane-bound lytic murein transglycosylase D